VSEPAKAAAEAVKAKMLSGQFVIFKGELKSNAGKVVIPEGTEQVQTDPALESMSYLVEGVIGSTGTDA
jgi:simple sugar transport system substrate-binding protein